MNPVLVEITRGDRVESIHRGAIAVADPSGALVDTLGEVDRPVFPRSAVKPLQALPLLESGAPVTVAEIALACASHSGEPRHVEAVAAWLARLGLGPADLECGAQWPINPQAARALSASPSALHNNCSGKHAGFLATARHFGEPTGGYIAPDHPVQRRVTATLAEMTGMARMEWGIDGCGIPTHAIPLANLARAMAHLADPSTLPPQRAAAARRVAAAMTAEPFLVAGTGRICTDLMTAAPGIIAKGGAEGVYMAALPARGLGIAIKIDDGAGRAAEAALLGILTRLGALDAETAERLRRPILNVAGRVVGEVRDMW
ncbi:MAG: asparaginase [Alphaproteobacteria bacterium]|nr:asparaginase [Alphaproteobacteria bacterium]